MVSCKLMMKKPRNFSNILVSIACLHLVMEAISLAFSSNRCDQFHILSALTVLGLWFCSLTWLIILVQVVGTLFSHHQKCVILDTQSSGNNRKITSFIGGLDLCDGRYDTPEHRLFHDLHTVFENDFHNPTFPVSSYYTYPEIFAWRSLFIQHLSFFWHDIIRSSPFLY